MTQKDSRVVIEKPFGYDYKSADHLQSVVERHLREKQVYRIDHYLGKDTVNNILATRFSNILLGTTLEQGVYRARFRSLQLKQLVVKVVHNIMILLVL